MVTANTSVSLACALPPVAALPALHVSPCWWTQHLASARSTHRLRQQGIACAIIE